MKRKRQCKGTGSPVFADLTPLDADGRCACPICGKRCRPLPRAMAGIAGFGGYANATHYLPRHHPSTDGVATDAPTDEEVAAWADSFIREHAYNRPVAVQIAVEAAKWVRSRIAGVTPTEGSRDGQP